MVIFYDYAPGLLVSSSSMDSVALSNPKRTFFVLIFLGDFPKNADSCLLLLTLATDEP
jgi:hypothetical protein